MEHRFGFATSDPYCSVPRVLDCLRKMGFGLAALAVDGAGERGYVVTLAVVATGQPLDNLADRLAAISGVRLCTRPGGGEDAALERETEHG
ncbi:MAG: hypothetical protein LPL00_05890 [Alphaproteobacteria bacterium]|nr:hypothetical protein [Alphaproteobacteria bacterium]MDX5369068.1 hypothetical protein [Alphaproteobacteria bacterium]MDX5463772.1 hypothetical protein [Alphaproteobacteria bacterium]